MKLQELKTFDDACKIEGLDAKTIIPDFSMYPKQAVKSNKKYFKSVIKLDKSFHVYVHANPENLEKGFDKERDMKFYNLFYKEEE
ncbi:MAG: hypothetical protein JXR60_06030 [Bacteroidales bacterium]|nr:hypothetical protein [Bacteroidales bacterium]